MPVPTGAEAAAFDHKAQQRAGMSGTELMENAGRAAADLAQFLAPEGPVVVLAGTGNNGGDAVVAARTLFLRGREVRLVAPDARPLMDPLLHGHEVPRFHEDQVEGSVLERWLSEASLVVDGLLGIGLKDAPRRPVSMLIEAANRAPTPVLSLDIASGVDADTGRVPGVAIEADVTLAFGWPKLGSLMGDGRGLTGRLIAADIGFPPLDDPSGWAGLFTPAWAAARHPRRALDTHKNQVGAVAIVAGSEGMAGAVILAGRAAYRSGAGYVRLVTPACNREIVQITVPDAPWVSLEDREQTRQALGASRAAVVGPGLSQGAVAEAALEAAIATASQATELACVFDADALNLLAEGRPFGLARLASHDGVVVLTPHPGEMARLLGCEIADVQADRIAAARMLAMQSGAIVVLKGTPSLVASADGRIGISGVTSSDLAKAGMGDVLAGSIAALLAQGLDAFDAAGVALVWGALAAQQVALGPSLMSSDMPDAIAEVISELTFATAPATDLPFDWATLEMDPAR